MSLKWEAHATQLPKLSLMSILKVSNPPPCLTVSTVEYHLRRPVEMRRDEPIEPMFEEYEENSNRSIGPQIVLNGTSPFQDYAGDSKPVIRLNMMTDFVPVKRSHKSIFDMSELEPHM